MVVRGNAREYLFDWHHEGVEERMVPSRDLSQLVGCQRQPNLDLTLQIAVQTEDGEVPVEEAVEYPDLK